MAYKIEAVRKAPVMNNETLPSMFVSHGAPSLVIEQNETVTFLRGLGQKLGEVSAVLCVSAHWMAQVPTASADPEPETIHDFGGFPAIMYELHYKAKGAPHVAMRAVELLKDAGIEARVSTTRGLDHGAWVPLMLIYPEGDVPVTQLSLQAGAGPAAHFRLGRALAPLRHEGVLILTTGSATHNLAHLRQDNQVPDWARQFDEWLYQKITGGDYEELLDYRRLAPHAALAHPTEEHLLPLFVAAGAGADVENPHGKCLHRGWTHGSLSMAVYAF
jgi:4,5-DOPA dioxygenase extradiol